LTRNDLGSNKNNIYNLIKYCFHPPEGGRILGKIKANHWYKKIIAGVYALVVTMFLSVSGNCLAADYDWIKIYPEHVGVFTSVGKQQFVAFGYTQSGNRTNITDQVDWISSNENLVTFGEKGMATVVEGVTSGQVKITCSYPKTNKGKVGTSVNLLLLSPVQ